MTKTDELEDITAADLLEAARFIPRALADKFARTAKLLDQITARGITTRIVPAGGIDWQPIATLTESFLGQTILVWDSRSNPRAVVWLRGGRPLQFIPEITHWAKINAPNVPYESFAGGASLEFPVGQTVQMTKEPETFEPTAKAREILTQTSDRLSNAVAEEFFDLWELEGDPRQAGSLVAHKYLWQAARIAIFGAMCAGREPSLKNWIATCTHKFKSALEAATDAFAEEEKKP